MKYKNKKIVYKYKKVVLGILLIFLIYFLLLRTQLVSPVSFAKELDKGIHWNMITINTVFAGFLFTTLGLIVGVMDTITIKKFEKGNYMDAIYLNITLAIYSSIISIICSLISIFIVPCIELYSQNVGVKLMDLIELSYIGLGSVELVGMMITILFFIYSVGDIKKIIKSLRKHIKYTKLSDEDVDDVLRQIKKK